MTRIQLNHAILTTPVDRLYTVNTEDFSYDLSNLKYGWNVVLMYCWLAQKVRFGSMDVNKLLKGTLDIKTVKVRLCELANRDVVVMPDQPYRIYGANIISPVSIKFLQRDAAAVIKLMKGHPFVEQLDKMIGSRYGRGANIIEAKPLEELIATIDFPIPSIAILIKALGYNYIIDNPYIDNNIILGLVGNEQLYIKYKTKYKFMSFDTFAHLASLDLLTEPITTIEAFNLGIITNDITRG